MPPAQSVPNAGNPLDSFESIVRPIYYEFTVASTTYVRGLRNTHATCRFCVGGCAMAHPGDEVGDEDSGLRTEDKRRHTTGLARTIDEKKDGPCWKRFPNDRR